MGVAHTTVDIPALKARHPLGDTVEAAGVQLRGRGRVRQGVCPFHEEAEGSFTVYSDSERFYCFGCGLGGDVLDFRPENREPESARDPAATGRQTLALHPGLLIVQSRTRRRQSPLALPPRNPNLLDRQRRGTMPGQLRRSLEGPGHTLPRRGIGPAVCGPPGPWLLAWSRAAAGSGVPRLLGETASGTPDYSRQRARSGSPAWWSYPRSHLRACHAGLRDGPSNSDGQAPLPEPSRPQASAWAWQARTRTAMGSGGRGTLRLAHPCRLGSSLPSPPWAPRVLTG